MVALLACVTLQMSAQNIRVNTMPSWLNNPKEGNVVVGTPVIIWGTVFGTALSQLSSYHLTVDNIDITSDSLPDPYPPANDAYAYDHYVGRSYTFNTCGIHRVKMTVNTPDTIYSNESFLFAYEHDSLVPDSLKVDMMIDKALLYLFKKVIYNTTSERLLVKPIDNSDTYEYGATAASILAFVERGHFYDNDLNIDPYAEMVALCLKYITEEYADYQDIQVQDGHNTDLYPGPNLPNIGAGKGVYLFIDDYKPMYANCLGILACFLSFPTVEKAQMYIINEGELSDFSIYDALLNCLDMIYYNQGNLNSHLGSWRYEVDSDSYSAYDGSTQQWPFLVLRAAQLLWNNTIPDWVIANGLFAYNQISADNGGVGYTNTSGGSLGKTGGKLIGLATNNEYYPNASSSYEIINEYFRDFYCNKTNDNSVAGWPGDLYSMYSIKKGLYFQGVDSLLVKNGSDYIKRKWHHDMISWLSGGVLYNLPSRLVQNNSGLMDVDHTYGQCNDGHWEGSIHIGDEVVETAFAILILNPHELTPFQQDSIAEFQLCAGDSLMIISDSALIISIEPSDDVEVLQPYHKYILNPAVSKKYSILYIRSGEISDCPDSVSFLNVSVLPPPQIALSNHYCIHKNEPFLLQTATGGTANTSSWEIMGTSSGLLQELYFTALDNTTTTLRLTVTDSNGCKVVDTTRMIVADVEVVSADTMCCVGEECNISVQGSPSFFWNIGTGSGNIQVFNVFSNTVVNLQGINDACTTSKQITVHVFDNPALLASMPDCNTYCTEYCFCGQDSISIQASGAQYYQWNGISGGDNFSVVLQSSMNVLIYGWNEYFIGSDSAICTDTTSISLAVKALPSVNIISDKAYLCVGDTMMLQAVSVEGITCQWSNGETEISVNVAPLADTWYSVTATDTCGCKDSTGILVKVYNNPALNHMLNVPLCHGDTGSVFLYPIFSNSLGLTYHWAPPHNYINVSTLTGIPQGTYQVTVSDTLGCSTSLILTLPEPPELSYQYNLTPGSCCGDPGSLQFVPEGGSPPYLLNWFGQQPLFNAGNIYYFNPANMAIQLVDAHQCDTVLNFSITAPPPFSFTNVINMQDSCFGDSTGQINISVEGCASPYQWQLTHNGNPFSGGIIGTAAPFTWQHAGLPAGNYLFTITDKDLCDTTFHFTIIQPGLLQAQLNILNTVFPCHGDSTGSATAWVSGGSMPYSHHWSNGMTTQQVNHVLPAGPFTDTITDSRGCRTILQGLMTEPDVLELHQQVQIPSCYAWHDGMIEMSATGGVPLYVFINQGDTLSGTIISGLATGNYFLTVLDDLGCTKTDTIFLPQPDSIRWKTIHDDVTCPGKSNGNITLDSISGGTPLYHVNGDLQDSLILNSIVFSDLGMGTYAFYLSDAHNCPTDSVFVTIGYKSKPEVAIGWEYENVCNPNYVSKDTAILCLSDSMTLTASQIHGYGPFSYSWFPLECCYTPYNSSTIIFPDTTINLYVVATDYTLDLECRDTARIKIRVEKKPSFSILSNCLDESVDLRPTDVSNQGMNDRYEWFDGQNTYENTIYDPGTYWLRICNDFCPGYDTVRIVYCPHIWIPNSFSPNGDDINDIWLPIMNFIPLEFELVIVNNKGEIVFLTNDISTGWEGDFYRYRGLYYCKGRHMGPAPEGMYVYIMKVKISNIDDPDVIVEEKRGSILLFR